MFKTLKYCLAHRTNITYTLTQEPGETGAEFDARYAKEEQKHYAKFGITL